MKPNTQLLKGYLKKYPNTPALTLAKLIVKENPKTFQNIESVRTNIRMYRGNIKSDKSPDPTFINRKITSKNPFELPPTEAKDYEIFEIPITNNRILFLSDIHIPYHNVEALTLALQYGKEKRVNTIYLNGDIMDCYQASDHEKDPTKRSLAYEVEQTENFLKSLIKYFPECKIYFKEGNHSRRWKRFLRRCAPQVLGFEEFELPVILKLREKGIDWIPNETPVKVGKLNMVHGNEFKGGGGINPGKQYYDKAVENIIGGDKHRTSEFIKRSIGNKVEGGWSVGCLCELNPEYMPLNNWNLGFAYIEVFKDGNFIIENKKIINGNVL